MKRVALKPGISTPDEALSASDSTCYVTLSDHIQRTRTTSQDEGFLLSSILPEQYSGSVWSLEALAIPMTYMSTGLMYSFPQANLEYFPRSLGASDAQLSTVAVVRALPWSFKVLFGLLPDVFPLYGQRFTPYLFLGCVTASFFHLLLSIRSATDSLTIVSFTLLLLGATVGVVMADVMADALVAHRVLLLQQKSPKRAMEAKLQQEDDSKTKKQPEGTHLQTTVYLCRFASEMVGYWLGAVLSNKPQWGWGASMGQQFAFLAFIPLVTVLPSLRYFYEPTEANGPMPLEEQAAGIWLMLQRRATWQPVCFLVLTNALFVQNASWGNFLKVAYNFNAFEYGALSGIGATVTFASIVVYRLHILPRYEAPWHDVYFITGFVVAGFSLLNVLLVLQVNETFGIPPFWFAMGDAAGESFARGFQYLPVAQMFVAVCPEQQEGVAFALLTSVTNLAQAFANTISNMLLHIWPVELKDLQKRPHDFSGVWKLSVLTSIIPLIPLVFLTTRLLPKGPRQLEEMRHQLSPIGAAVVVGLYAFGFVWVIVLSMLAIFSPCHVLVGGHGCH
ncbi:hypothetical protein PR003_g16811 [Phytophthora rubi]|uniref:Folate-biopterin transporter n=1 Tax=Phytophthora rubi TaxID=129364 RepID=A0A6A3LB15_9STRA|nr:hypothetical protein PR002_g16594 [Phytophthora rubi]KAE9013003.1 hypothetical protein PR001_g15519 [Phytophthora rubi]KAE9324120.1 hypothetical protein PR003_g16811 [Phytophthora rubi]